ncbi:MAG: glycosyltransferase family 39 protein, partial [Acidobacteriota bacterium]|nr:glycosyltransferase family 39 protein [Acidobacteriota bacterium]
MNVLFLYPSTMKLDARSAIAPTILSAVAASLFFLHLGRGALRDWDEAIYAEVSREMLLTRDWLTPHWQYLPFFEKPPLLFWIQSSVFRLFGVTEFWARFPAAIAGVFVVLLTFLLTRRLAGSFAALLAALALLTTRDFVNLTRQGMMATPLTLCVLAALYAWVRVREGSPRWLYGVAL